MQLSREPENFIDLQYDLQILEFSMFKAVFLSISIFSAYYYTSIMCFDALNYLLAIWICKSIDSNSHFHNRKENFCLFVGPNFFKKSFASAVRLFWSIFKAVREYVYILTSNFDQSSKSRRKL